jgi:hypothetical protein
MSDEQATPKTNATAGKTTVRCTKVAVQIVGGGEPQLRCRVRAG